MTHAMLKDPDPRPHPGPFKICLSCQWCLVAEYLFIVYLFDCTRSWLQHAESNSLTRGRNRAPALGAWTTREVQRSLLFF